MTLRLRNCLPTHRHTDRPTCCHDSSLVVLGPLFVQAALLGTLARPRQHQLTRLVAHLCGTHQIVQGGRREAGEGGGEPRVPKTLSRQSANQTSSVASVEMKTHCQPPNLLVASHSGYAATPDPHQSTKVPAKQQQQQYSSSHEMLTHLADFEPPLAATSPAIISTSCVDVSLLLLVPPARRREGGTATAACVTLYPP